MKIPAQPARSSLPPASTRAVQGHNPGKPAVTDTFSPARPEEAYPVPESATAWVARSDEPSLFGRGLTSSLLMALCGPVAVAVSKAGAALEKLGQRKGWWKQLGKIYRPLPPSLLKDLPPSKLERPFLMVPGFHTPKDRFDHLVEKLTEDGSNGGHAYYVARGQFFLDKDCTLQATPDPSTARVFVAVFDSTNTPPHEAGPDLALSLKAIQEFTGQPKVDVCAYSMGGQASRLYLDQGGDAIGKLMMLGTPNQGAALARTSLGLLDLQRSGYDTDWLLSRKPLTQEDRFALGWLLPVDGGSQNPQLSDLNSRWDHQRSRTEAVKLVGANSRFTLGRWFIPAGGDGTVTGSSLELKGEHTVFLKNPNHRNHGLLFSNPQTYTEMRSFFRWDR